MTTETADRMVEIVGEMTDLLSEFKQICRESMTRREYEQFKYRTLGHIEPALMEDTEWYTRYSSIDSLEKVAKNALGEVEDGGCGADEDDE